MSSGKWRPFCLGLNVLSQDQPLQMEDSPEKENNSYLKQL